MTIGLNMKSPGNSGAFFRIRARAAAEPAGFDAFFIGCLDRLFFRLLRPAVWTGSGLFTGFVRFVFPALHFPPEGRCLSGFIFPVLCFRPIIIGAFPAFCSPALRFPPEGR